MKRARSFLGSVEAALDAAGKYLGRIGTVGKLAQYAPVVLGLLVVFFSPNAWLSATLRRWALGGVAVGAIAGGAALARVGVRSAHKQGLAFVLLLALLISAALLRLHVAIADVAFVERWPLLRPLQDLYLGSDGGEAAFNALTALGFAAVVATATLGFPVYLAWLRERRQVRAAASEGSAPALHAALDALAGGVRRLEEQVATLRTENAALRAELDAARSGLDRNADEPEAPDERDRSRAHPD